ncbi:metal ABC transporter permease [Odoribacter sp. Z80]|uniref:metal ABC transporter permease n=1 Tax=Odoribacter sp. Z80 TaxID=2304575 RepID=UPI001F36E5DE|nr:metal ABC transporter permease [Odoribacter sp. Z80]
MPTNPFIRFICFHPMLELLKYDFFQNALFSTIFIGISCGLIGTYIVAKRMVFISGGITHASFGGLGLAYYLGISPMLGATVFSLLSILGIWSLSENKKFREDSLIGIFWSAGMAIGILFIYLTPGYAPNLMSYLFGNILTVTSGQILLSALLCVLIILFFLKFFRPLFYIAFDKEYSLTHHVHINAIDISITILIALCIVLCLKLAGIILVISYLTLPQAIAGIYYKNFKQQLIASALISTLGSVTGLFISAQTNLPSGATIVIGFLILFIISWLVQKIRK